ncbi:MAG: tRNA (adenosine(37)-N6)-dimethylallyltransferase MiaA [Pseudomonadota bacterium]
MGNAERRIWLIAGPTASGKSALALHLADQHDAVIINTDSMQVYSILRLITARPSPEDEARATHVLYGHVDPSEAYSTAKWMNAVSSQLQELLESKPVIFVGGTGLYFKALLEGISDIPDVPSEVRTRWRGRLSEEGPAALHRLLQSSDLQSASQIKPTDGQRLVRALEVLEASGHPLSYWQGKRRSVLQGIENIEKIVLLPDRDVTRERIKKRFGAILREGGVDEVGQLLERDLDPSLPAMKAIGVSVCRSLLAGEITVEEALERGVIETSQYAKRQRTWFRNQFDQDWQLLGSD